MKKLLLSILVSASLIACTNQETKTTNGDDTNIATFKENSKVVEKAFEAFVKNDLDAWSVLFADTAKFSSPVLGDTVGAILVEAIIEDGLDKLTDERLTLMLDRAARAAAITVSRTGARPPGRDEI